MICVACQRLPVTVAMLRRFNSAADRVGKARLGDLEVDAMIAGPTTESGAEAVDALLFVKRRFAWR
jgi:hypothetical protein